MWSSELAAQWASLRACTGDADCALATVASRCGAACNDAIRNDQIAAINQWASARADELCASCVADAPACATSQPTRAVCTNGACVGI